MESSELALMIIRSVRMVTGLVQSISPDPKQPNLIHLENRQGEQFTIEVQKH
jgi:hypothetical protein